MNTLTKKFWLSLTIFSLTGQIAWVVCNMYFNVFIYKIFRASAADISWMVALSAITAAITTLLIGALSDKLGKRKIFISGGYVLWGISISSFSLLRLEWLEGLAGNLTAAMSLGVTLVILLACVMTFFGSTANDASFNAWLTDSGKHGNRGAIEGINAMMPLLAVLLVFGSFMAFDLDKESSWTVIFLIIGVIVMIIGVLGFFLIEEKGEKKAENQSYFRNVFYSFRPQIIKENKLLYTVLIAFAVFGISLQVFMPYLILYYDIGLGMENYTLVLAPAVLLAAVATLIFGKLYDKLGFRRCIYPAVFILMVGFIILFSSKIFALVFIGSILMMSGQLAGMAIFGAKIRDNTPKDKAGMFQGIRIFGQVLIPQVIGPAIGALVLSNAKTITNPDGTVSFIPNSNIFLAAFAVTVFLLVILGLIFRMVRNGQRNLPTDFVKMNEVPYSDYPRPQLRRDSYINLNGVWENGINVPFSPQSFLSGKKGKVGNRLTYTRKFTLPKGFLNDKLLLHFGAVDQKAFVFVNDKPVGSNEGGYLPFTIDITNAYQTGENRLTVKVVDKLSPKYPYGKQRKKRGEMWYTPVSGIWQSVWLESVPADYIEKLKITPDLTGINLEVKTNAPEYEVTIPIGDSEIKKRFRDKKVRIDIKEEGFEPILWEPENPYLYDLRIKTAGGDEITSYFGLRTVNIRAVDGINRICLNGKPVFLHGVLDQGYFSDGIYLPASPDGYRFDIAKMKELGFNTLRKHIKIEPECFYHFCDQMGMLVMQDMVNSGRYSFFADTVLPTLGMIKHKDHHRFRNKRHREIFINHTKETMAHLNNHPCIIYYTIFNEGWGQFASDHLYELAKKWDDSRIIDTTSGWFVNEKSDVDSSHIYFKEVELKMTKRPHILSEFGGFSHLVANHHSSLYHQHGYGFFDDQEALTDTIISTYEKMVLPAIKKGLCGSVYTQLSDIEDEVNGLYTYDRKILKVNKELMLDLKKKIMSS
ncbi:MAG: MFS transporter [Lachnospiraceae bacterium]|nr:MFS transporter [Lachnospiraceae bacterium]